MTSYAHQQAKANIYKQQNVMTAAPGELTLMLYDGCVKEVKHMRLYIETGEIEKANDAALQAQAIISELMRTLNMQVEMSKDLYRLYEYILGKLVYANIHKKAEKTDIVLELLAELRDAWQQAVRANRSQVIDRKSTRLNSSH